VVGGGGGGGVGGVCFFKYLKLISDLIRSQIDSHTSQKTVRRTVIRKGEKTLGTGGE